MVENFIPLFFTEDLEFFRKKYEKQFSTSSNQLIKNEEDCV